MFSKWIGSNTSEKWNKEFEDNRVVSVLEWIAMLAIIVIPVVNLIMLFKWAFANKEMISANKVNLARAFIILFAVMLFSVALVFGILLLGWLLK